MKEKFLVRSVSQFAFFGSLAGLLSSLLLTACSSQPVRQEPSTSSQGSVHQSPPLLADRERQNSYDVFDWPVIEARFSRGFMPQKRRPHLGIDLAGPKGSPILAAHDGVVVYVGSDFRGFGNMILIEGENGQWASLYAHLTKAHVRQGQRVRNGQQIGSMGATGRATGVHLHFEIRKNRAPVDPLLYLPNGRKVANQIARNDK